MNLIKAITIIDPPTATQTAAFCLSGYLSRGGHSHKRCVQSCDRGQNAVQRSRHLLGIGQAVFWALSPA